MTLTQLIIIGLSTYAITYMLRHVDGPFDVFAKLRVAAGLQYLDEVNIDNETVTLEIVPDRFVPKLYSCFWCLGTWVALSLLTFYQYIPILVEWLAVLGFAAIFYEIINGKNN